MKLPNYKNAIIEIGKLTEYCLNEYHPEGKHKARVFKSVLGVTINEAEYLISIIIDGIDKYQAFEKNADAYGKRFCVDIELNKNSVTIVIRTNWIIRVNEENPRLTSCFIKI